MEQYTPIAAIIIAVVGFCVQFGMFVRPVELEKKHREILNDVENKYLSLSVFNEFKKNVEDRMEKIDRIYECIVENKSCKK
jgi:hypothetical protein